MLPPHERFECGDEPGRELDLRLVVQLELAGADGPAQIAHETEPRRVEAVELGIEADHVDAAGLRGIHRDVGVLLQRARVVAVLGIARPADARLRADRDAGEVDLDPDGLAHALQHRGHVTLVDVGEHETELVTTEAGDGVAGSQRGLEVV